MKALKLHVTDEMGSAQIIWLARFFMWASYLAVTR